MNIWEQIERSTAYKEWVQESERVDEVSKKVRNLRTEYNKSSEATTNIFKNIAIEQEAGNYDAAGRLQRELSDHNERMRGLEVELRPLERLEACLRYYELEAKGAVIEQAIDAFAGVTSELEDAANKFKQFNDSVQRDFFTTANQLNFSIADRIPFIPFPVEAKEPRRFAEDVDRTKKRATDNLRERMRQVYTDRILADEIREKRRKEQLL